MKVQIENLAGKFEYLGTNSQGKTIHLASSPEAVSPMESLLMAAASCSAVDVELILEKMRQRLDKLEIEVEGERAEDQVPKKFVRIHLIFRLFGEIKVNKAEQVVQMAVEKYCSVIQSLNPEIEIKYEVQVNP